MGPPEIRTDDRQSPLGPHRLRRRLRPNRVGEIGARLVLGAAWRRRKFRHRDVVRIRGAPARSDRGICRCLLPGGGRGEDSAAVARVLWERARRGDVGGLAITMPAAPTLPPPIHNQACLVVGGVYAGPAEEGMKVMQPLRELGTPLADISQPMPFNGVQTAFDALFPMGKLQSYWKAQNLASLPDRAIEVIAARANQRPSPLTLVVTFQMGGAINRVGATDTAYAERSAPWMSSIDGNWENPADNAKNIAWVRESFAQIAPYSTGTTYTNFTGQADESAGALASTAYGKNMERLRRIKSTFDPDNFFRLNANIAPAAAATA